MTVYVVGFVTDGKKVLLIKKNRPKWQKNLFNGLGGVAKDGETPLEAMRRETREECSLVIEDNNWLEIDTLEYPENDVTLHIFQAKVSKKFIKNYKTTTDEVVRLFKIKNLPKSLVADVEFICKKRLLLTNSEKKLFKFTYLDEFGNGLTQYINTTKNQIKKIARDLFNEEKLKASSGDLNSSYGPGTKLYNFDEDSCKGYVIKDVGFTLKHSINYEELSFKMEEKYIYELTNNFYMCREIVKTFKNLKNGKRTLKKLSLESVKGYKLAKEDYEGKKISNGVVKKDKNGNYSCNYYYWNNTSYEYDEWDIDCTKYILKPYEIINL
jgi:8-oxo-dGTP pyrophosphatase MutT (NUDIX family)